MPHRCMAGLLVPEDAKDCECNCTEYRQSQIVNKIEKRLKYLEQKVVVDVSDSTDWDSWLSEYETNLKELGYRKFVQNHKNEDFCYWKTFKNGEDKIYQIGLLFYDFRKYAERAPNGKQN